MKIFLEVEGKMGLIPASQFRPPLPDNNPNIRKNSTMEKRKRAVPKFNPSTYFKPTTMHLPATIAKVPARNDVPENRPPPLKNVPVYKSTPWPGEGKMSGNLFDERNWLLPPNYLATENKSDKEPGERKGRRK